MHLSRQGKLIRTDIWREGKWLDLWSVVHLLSGASIGFAFYFLSLNSAVVVTAVFLGLIGYEIWEKAVQIEEVPTNRILDVIVGVLSFLPVYYVIAPRLSSTALILVFGFVLTADTVMSVFGWIASRKAVVLETRLRERAIRRRARRLKRESLLRSSI
ncbi:hypothetical protein KGM48_02750 [Patescibacteria group bacterium]|nr:hypothetical protein [Patescibacteria group bacterium]